LGVIPAEAELSPINPYAQTTGPQGQPWPETENVRPCGSLSADEKRLFCRMAEVYAGFLSHADDQIGRLLDDLEGQRRAGEHDRGAGVRQWCVG
jgi:arylsulfatase A-like enzyme